MFVREGRSVSLGRIGPPLLLVLAACSGRRSTAGKDASTDAAVSVAGDAGARTAASSGNGGPRDDASTPPPASRSSRTGAEHIRRAKEICAKPSATEGTGTEAGYAQLADGKRDAAFRSLHDAIRPPGTAPIAEQAIRDGFPDGYEAIVGSGSWVIASGRDWSYLFRGSSLVRRFRGRASFIQGTDLLHVADGPGTTLVRMSTGDVVFRAVSTDGYAARAGAGAIVHTRCDGGQELVVFAGTSSSRTLATTLDARNALETSNLGPDDLDHLGWIDDEHLWMRGAQSSVVIDVTKGMVDSPPAGASEAEPDWGVVTPHVDPKRTVAVAHYGTPGPDKELSTVLIDWQQRKVLRRADTGPHGLIDPLARFTEDGVAFVLRDTPCELLLFKPADLGVRRISQRCGDAGAPSPLLGLRFWPKPDTLFIEEPSGVTLLNANTGNQVARYPISPSAKGHFIAEGGSPDAAFVIEECVTQEKARRSSQIQTKVTRDLKSARTEKPVTTCGEGDKRGEALLTSLGKSVCTVETIEGVVPREVCNALRSENKDAGAPAKGDPRRKH